MRSHYYIKYFPVIWLTLIVGNILPSSENTIGAAPFVGFLLSFVGIGFFIWGCMCYSKGKGHHPAWGILGLFNIIGLIVLAFFSDKHKDT